MTTNKWSFHIGIHRGTYTSRDSELPREINSLDECRSEAYTAQRQYAALGCKIWFCYAVGPNNERIKLLPSEAYLS